MEEWWSASTANALEKRRSASATNALEVAGSLISTSEQRNNRGVDRRLRAWFNAVCDMEPLHRL